MQALLGVLYHSIGGFASGSFYMPFNKVKGWAWESSDLPKLLQPVRARYCFLLF